MSRALDLTNQRFGKLVAIRRLNEKKRGCYLWECKCDCGNICKVVGSSLTCGNTKSCGCGKYDGLKKYNNEQSEKSKIPNGTRFGKLTVIEDIGFKPQIEGHQRRWYRCQCDCGNTKEVMGNMLKAGQVSSCGLCNLNSIGEFNIINLLQENHISFLHDTYYQPLVEETGRKLRFDFIIFNGETYSNVIRFVEFDGRQHIDGPDTEYWSRTKDTLETIKERDNIKNTFCLSHNIPLVRIPFYKAKTLCLEDIMGDKYLVKGVDES